MTFSNPGRTALAAAALLAMTLGLTACSSNTIDFAFVATVPTTGISTTAGTIHVYEVDHLSGVLRPRSTAAAGIDPVSMVAASFTGTDGNTHSNLYVVNQVDNTVEQFSIGDDGQLAKVGTLQTPGTLPVAIAIDATDNFLYVVDTYRPGASSGAGALAVIKLDGKGNLGSLVANGSLNYWPVGVAPTAIAAVESNSYPTGTCSGSGGIGYQTNVFVTTTNPTGYTPVGGALYSFVGQFNSTACSHPGASATLTSFAATSPAATTAGTAPTGVVADPRGRFVYVIDYSENQMYGFSLSNNIPTRLTSSPYKTGTHPTAITVDPRGLYLMVTNYSDSTVVSYSIDPATGIPSSGISATGSTTSGPVAVAVEPALGRYVYTANHVDSSASGFSLNPSSGSLAGTQNSPYPTGGQPTSIVLIPHGDHPTESLTP